MKKRQREKIHTTKTKKRVNIIGFTLIELVVVFSIFFVVTVAGLASFRNFNSSRILESASGNIITVLNDAKVNSVTQVIQGNCTQQLERYSVRMTHPNTFTLWIYCGGTGYPLKDYRLPEGVVFGSPSSYEIEFFAGSGRTSGGIIRVTDSVGTKVIQVDTGGNITGS